MTYRFLISFTCLMLSAHGSAPNEEPRVVPSELFSVPEGFEVTIWAQSPLLRNPTNMDIDARGRIWVTEGVNYRKHADREADGDRVVMLEDVDGDGRADKSTVFVQESGLIAPMGIAVIDNRIIISNAPDVIVYDMKDLDRPFDPRIDSRDVLLTGFNGTNSDHSLHSASFGPDGKLYFNQGNAGAHFTDRSGKTFRIGGNVGGKRDYNWRPTDLAGAMSDDGHVYVGGFMVRVNPDGTNAQIFGHNFRNSYEQCVTSFGDVFHNDNDDPPACRTSFVLEHGSAGFYSRDGLRTWQADKRPGQSTQIAEWRQHDPGVMPAGDVYGTGAPTGIVSYEGDLFGPEWRGLLISADSVLNTLLGYFPQPDGAGYRLEHFTFLTTNKDQILGGIDTARRPSELNTWFRPSDVAVGPDGAIYVADWFDPRSGGHVDLDDSTSGAIYRIAPKGFKSTIPHFDLTTTEGQIAALKSPAVNVRASGYLRLKKQGAAAVEAVAELLEDENPFIRARAVWLLAHLGPEGLALVESQLSAADARIRVTAFRAIRQVKPDILDYAHQLVADESPAVRREVALALRDVPLHESGELLVKLAASYDGVDRTYLEAWGIGCTGKEAEIAAMLARNQPIKDATLWSTAYSRLLWRLTPVAESDAFADRANSSALTAEERIEAVTALGFMPTKKAAYSLLDLAQNSASPSIREQALWWLLNYRNTRWADMGVDEELKQRGLYDPASIKLVEIVVPEPTSSNEEDPTEIMNLVGDPIKGKALAGSCMLCHRIGDNGIDYGPDLTGFARQQTVEVLIDAILYPSADISLGYEGYEIILNDGKVIHGLVLSSGDPTIVRSTGGIEQSIPVYRIKSKEKLPRSLMLSAAQLGFSHQDIADVVAYMKNIKP